MRAVDLIVKKRNGGELSESEIQFLVKGYTSGAIPDYQVSALLMAIYFGGMNFEETAALTRAMIGSGRTIDLSGISGPFIDKHSTGGVGDKISLLLAPIVAACGVKVPMLCGRGLGHTGGTIDKLESIPGYRTSLSEREIRGILSECGFVFMGQTESIAPADKLLYALRDVTGTVESIPLITASILSKKAAEGSDGFVFDVKAGSGAFMKTEAAAKELAESLVKTTRVLDKKASAVVTAMDEPLGRFVGNLVEVRETVRALLGDIPSDIGEVTYRLGARMLMLAGRAGSIDEGAAACRSVLESGAAYRLFVHNVAAQGGDPDFIAAPEMLEPAPRRFEIKAEKDGWVAGVDAFKIGNAAVLLGAGRAIKESGIAPRAGIELVKKRGEEVERGAVVCSLYCEEGLEADEAAALARAAYTVSDEPPESRRLILYEMEAS
ncbi:MAG: thymidine phosphorylase [Spirochaetales bacterium]|nr:thymidine phosphorylase [Spirochaetales bacterium]